MLRQARFDTPGTLHHAMIRGIEGRRIFQGDRDREHFLSRVRTLVKGIEGRIFNLDFDEGFEILDLRREGGASILSRIKI